MGAGQGRDSGKFSSEAEMGEGLVTGEGESGRGRVGLGSVRGRREGKCCWWDAEGFIKVFCIETGACWVGHGEVQAVAGPGVNTVRDNPGNAFVVSRCIRGDSELAKMAVTVAGQFPNKRACYEGGVNWRK